MAKTLREELKEAKKEVEDLKAIERGALSYNADNVEDVTINRWCRTGKVVTVDFEARAKVNIGAGSDRIITLPFEAAGPKGVVSWVGGKYNFNSPVWSTIYAGSKSIGVGEISAGSYIHISFTYIMN